jgi:hypothetical protein
MIAQAITANKRGFENCTNDGTASVWYIYVTMNDMHNNDRMYLRGTNMMPTVQNISNQDSTFSR